MSIPGWFMAGMAPADYDAILDSSERHSGTRCARLSCKIDRPSDFGTLMQEVLADDYRGQRVRMSGWVKTENVIDRCWLWMRVNGANGRMLVLDNMGSRPIRGTTPWTLYEVVLDVASDANDIGFGIGMGGTGVAWIDDVVLEQVGLDVPVTVPPRSRVPRNLLFEE